MLWRGRVRFPAGRHLELNVHTAFVLTVVGVSGVLAQAILPRLFPGWAPIAYWGVGTSVALVDAIAGLLHELGHALAAIAKGRSAYGITLYGPIAAARRSRGVARHDQFAIALAGPVGHLLVAAMLGAAWGLVPGENEPLRVATSLPAISNFATGVLNLLPISPLDGARALRALREG